MKKNYVLWFALLTIIMLGCRNEFETIEEKKVLHSDKINFSQFKNETKTNQFNDVIQTHALESSATANKGNQHDDILAVFKIDTTKINRLDFKENVTYSFRAYNYFEAPDKLYNLVYFFKEGKWNYSLLEIENDYSTKPLYDSRLGNVTSAQNTQGRGSCTEPYTSYALHCTGTGKCKEDGVCDGCDLCVTPSSGTMVFDCSGAGGGGGSGGDTGGGSNPGGTTGGFTDPSPYYFDPNQAPDLDPYYLRAARAYYFWRDQVVPLGYEAQQWAVGNSYTYIQLLENYLNNYSVPYSNENSQFHIWAIGFFMQNPNTTWEQFESWFIKGDLDYRNAEDVAFASNLSSVAYDLIFHNQAGTLNQLDFAWPKMDNVRSKIKEKFKNSIPVAVKYAKHLFSTLKTLTDNYPVLLTYANKGIDKMRNEIHNEGLINYDVHTMKWKDVVGCWLFELGNYPSNTTAGYGNMPTLGFAGADYVIAGIPGNASQMRFLMNHKTLSNGSSSPNSVLALKKQTINKIKNGDYSSTSGNWGFGFDATIDTISQFDGLQFCLGSYITTVNVTQIGTKTFELTFIVKNKTGWESGTRGLNNGDGNSSNDSVIPDKPRGQGLHLGGTIGETFGWKETITIP